MTRITPRANPQAGLREGRAHDGLSIAQMPVLLRRSWAWIAVPTLAVALGAGLFVQVVSPRYTGEAKLLLESREPAFARTVQERSDQATPIDEQAVASQVQVMMSRDVAREAIRRLKLVGNPEFDPSAGSISAPKRLMMMLGIGANPLERPAEDRVLDTYFERLLVYPAGKSRILAVEFRSKDPELAAEGANTVAELYISSLEAAKVDTARYASTWLGGNIDSLRRRVADAEAAVEAFRAKNGLIGTTGATGQPLNAQQLGELSTQLSQARTLKADLAGRVKAIKELIKDGRAFEIPDVANNELIRRTVENRIAVRAQLAMESRTLLPGHPRIKELTAQLSDLDAQIKSSAERVVRTLDNDAKIASARSDSLQAAVDGQQDKVVKGNSSEIQLRALEREAKVQREQLESYLTRYREAAARDAESATPADARIVSRAVTPEIPSFPKKVPIVAFATLLTLMLAVGTVIGRQLLSDPGDDGRPADPETGIDRERRTTARPENRFTFPEAAPASRRSAAQLAEMQANLDAVGRQDAAPGDWAEPARPARPARGETAERFDLEPLIARLSSVPVRRAGRIVLVIETITALSGGQFFDSLTGRLCQGQATLTVDLNGPESEPEEPGFTDLVAGEAAFLDVIQAVRGSGLHRIGTGFLETEVLREEPQALAITLDAMGEAYDWVLCRLRQRAGEADLLAEMAAHVDGIVIASNARADDPALANLFNAATQAGGRIVLVAQDRASVREAADADVESFPLRLSAA